MGHFNHTSWPVFVKVTGLSPRVAAASPASFQSASKPMHTAPGASEQCSSSTEYGFVECIHSASVVYRIGSGGPLVR